MPTLGGKRKAKRMIGRKFGKLTVISFSHYDKHMNRVWVCRCECGNLKKSAGPSLRAGSPKSCGCSSGLIPGVSGLNTLYATYIRVAKTRGYSWNLSKKKFKKLTQQNCYYCNQQPKNKTYHKNYKGHYIYNGIDRLNSKFGYSVKNTVPCCTKCNFMKNSWTEKEFITHIHKISNFYRRNNK